MGKNKKPLPTCSNCKRWRKAGESIGICTKQDSRMPRFFKPRDTCPDWEAGTVGNDCGTCIFFEPFEDSALTGVCKSLDQKTYNTTVSRADCRPCHKGI